MKITNDNFKSEVLESDIPVLLDSGRNGAAPAVCFRRWWKRSLRNVRAK